MLTLVYGIMLLHIMGSLLFIFFFLFPRANLFWVVHLSPLSILPPPGLYRHYKNAYIFLRPILVCTIKLTAVLHYNIKPPPTRSPSSLFIFSSKCGHLERRSSRHGKVVSLPIIELCTHKKRRLEITI